MFEGPPTFPPGGSPRQVLAVRSGRPVTALTDPRSSTISLLSLVLRLVIVVYTDFTVQFLIVVIALF